MEVMREAVEQSTEEFADLNREQLMYGYDAKGNRLRDYKSKSYAKKKAEMNPLAGFGTPDLRLTGAFHKSLGVNPTWGKAVPTASDSKTEKLLGMFKSNDPLGLNETSMKKYREILQPLIIQALSKRTGLTIK